MDQSAATVEVNRDHTSLVLRCPVAGRGTIAQPNRTDED